MRIATLLPDVERSPASFSPSPIEHSPLAVSCPEQLQLWRPSSGDLSERHRKNPAAMKRPGELCLSEVALAIYLNVNAGPVVLEARSTDVISVVKLYARTEMIPRFHVVKPRSPFHAAAFAKTAVTNLSADPIRAGRTRNKQRRRQDRRSCTSDSESAHESSSFTISLGKKRTHGSKGPRENPAEKCRKFWNKCLSQAALPRAAAKRQRL